MAYLLYPPLPEPLPVNSVAADDAHDLLFLDTEKALDRLGPEQRHAVDGWLSTSRDREKDLRSLAVKGFLEDTFREPGATPERLDVLRQQYAIHELDTPRETQVDKDTFFNLVKVRRQRNRDRKDLFVNVSRQAYEAALSLDPEFPAKRKAEVFAGLNADGVPGLNRDDLPNLYRLYNDITERVKFETQPERSAAREAAGLLRKDDDPNNFLFDYMTGAVDRIMKLPKDRRDIAIEFVRQSLSRGGGEQIGLGMRGKKPGTEDSTVQGSARAFARGASDVVRKLVSTGERWVEGLGARDDSEWRAVESKMRELVRGTLAPLNADGMIQQGIFGAAESVPAMAMIAAGPVGTALSVTYYQQGSYEKMKADPRMAGVSENKLSAMAWMSGTAQAALDKVQLNILSKLPGAATVIGGMKGIANPLGYVGSQVGKAAAGVAMETGIEAVQDYYVDAITQQVGAWLSSDIKSPEWAKVNAEALAALPELTMTMIPLVTVAHGVGGVRDIHSARVLASTPELLRMAGFGPSQALAISTAENPVGALRAMWSERDPMKGAPAGSTPAQVAQQAAADYRAARDASVSAASDAMATPGVSYVQRTSAGWQVIDTDGQTHSVASEAAVPALLVEIGKATTIREAEAMQQIADSIGAMEPAAKQVLTGDEVTVQRENGNVSVDSALKLIPFTPATLANFNAQLSLLGRDAAHVNGANWIAEDGPTLLANKSSEGVFTQVHELAERRFRSLIEADVHFGNHAIAAAKIVAPLFQVERPIFRFKKKVGEQSAAEREFAERVQRVASGKTTETEARETLVELVVADEFGRRKDGGAMPAGSITAGVSELINSSANPAERASLGKFRAFLRAVRSYLHGIFSTAAKLSKGRRDGIIKDGDDFTTFAEKLLGVDAVKEHQKAVIAEATGGDATASLSVGIGVETSGASFSLSSPAMLERIAAVEGDETTAGEIGLDESFHASRDRVLQVDPAAGRNTRQGSGKAGFYTAPTEAETAQYQRAGSEFVHRFTVPADARIKLIRKPGAIERLSPDQVAEWQAAGFFAAVGRALIGQKAEVVLLDSAASEAANTGATGSLSVPAQDAEYMAAVESGDMEKAQAMVDAAAKAAGYDLVHVRGEEFTDNGNVKQFVNANRRYRVENYKGYGVNPKSTPRFYSIKSSALASQNDPVISEWAENNDADLDPKDIVSDAGFWDRFDDVSHFWHENESYLLENGIFGIRTNDGGVVFDTTTALEQGAVVETSAVTRDESGNVIPLSLRFDGANAGATAGASASLGSVNTLEALAVQLENRIAAGGATVKLEAYADTARTLEGMARAARSNESVEHVLAVGEIEKQRAAMQKRMEDQYLEDVWRGPAGGILSAEDMAQVRSQPIMESVLRPLAKGEKGSLAGRLMSRKKAGTTGGEYDGVDGLPFWLFRGDRRPDQLAQELFEQGLLPEPSPDALWSAIHQAIDTAGRNREWLAKARQQIAEAKARARTESRTWAAAQRAKLAASDARDEKRSLVTLDALLANVPAEVRGRVGGFTRIAELTTNEARRKHLMAIIEKLDAEMERYLRRELVKEITATLQKGRARKVAGQKDKGPLGVNGHTWLETAERYMVMGEADLEARELYIDAILGGAEMSDAVIKELNRQWNFGTGEDAARMALEVEKGIADLFGGATHRDPKTREYTRGSGELEAAWKAAKERADLGRMEWERELEIRRTRREGRRAGLSIESGNHGRPSDIAAREKALQGFGGAAVKYFRKGFTFSEFIGDGFGRDGDTHRFAEDTAMEATLTESALWQASQNGLADFLRSLWPRSGKAARLRQLEALATPKKVDGAPEWIPELSEMQAVHLTMLWQDVDSRPWLRKWQYGDGAPEDPRDPAGPDVQAVLESHLSPQAKLIREWLQGRYDDQYDSLNDVFRRLHGVNMPRVKNYTPRMVEHGKDAAVIDPLGAGGLSARGVFSGFTKRRRINIAAAPVLADALRAYTQNQRVVTHFVAWAEASNELRAVFSTSASAPFIKGAMGNQGAADLNQWLSDLEAGGVREAQASEIWNRWLRANTASALFGKLGVLAKQIPAAYGAAVEIGWSDYLRSLRRVVTGKAARPVSGAVASRIMQARAFDRPAEVGQASSGTGVSPWDARLRRIGIPTERIDLAMDWLGGRIGATDAFFTARGAAIAYDAHFLDGKAQKMSDEAAHAYAERETERTISRTAQPDSVANKSLAENHAGTWGRIFNQFQSANRQALFMTLAAFRDGGMKSGDAWRKAVTHWIVTGIVTQTIGNLIRDALSDDNDDELWNLGDYGRAMLFGPTTGAVLGWGAFMDVLASFMGGFERRQAPSPIAAVTDFGKEMAELFKDDDAFEMKDGEKIGKALGSFLGGRWAALNVAANIGKQAVGFVDNLSTSEREKTDADANKQREADKAAREARESGLSPEQRAALKEARKKGGEQRKELDAARWRAAHPD